MSYAENVRETAKHLVEDVVGLRMGGASLMQERIAGYQFFATYISYSGRVAIKLRQAHNLLAAARFVRLLSPGDLRPVSERQVRPLTSLEPLAALTVGRTAVARAAADVHRLSGSLVERCARELGSQGMEEGYSEDGAPLSTYDDTSISERDWSEECPRAVEVFLSSKSVEWYTPAHFIELVREFFAPDGTDLDPCSSASANERVRAARYYDAQADGLLSANVWSGNVYVNPPFGLCRGNSLQGLFFERCVQEYEARRIRQAILLLKAAVGYGWFDAVLKWPVCFVRPRLSFVRGTERDRGSAMAWGSRIGNPHGSVVVYMSPNVQRFASVFGKIGNIPGATSWAMPRGTPGGDAGNDGA